MPNRVRNAGRAVILGGLVAACSDSPGQPERFTAELRLAPTIQAAAPVPSINQVRIRIGRAPAERVLDTTVAFPIDNSQLNLRLRVTLKARSERLGVTVDLLRDTQLYYSGSDTVLVVALGSGPAATPNLVLRYVGPGANIRTLRVGPRDSTLVLGDPLAMRLTALDAQGAPVTSFPVTWSTTDPLVQINQAGALVAPLRRVTIRVIATLPTGLADSANLTFVAKPVAVSVIAGGNQTGRPSAVLPTAFAVLVKAADSLPVAGVAVRFRTTVGGGSIRDSVVQTNAQGVAASPMSLGASLGANSYEATVLGLPPLTLTALATAGPAARLLYRSGGAQFARVNTAPSQLMVVQVTDTAGFPVSGEKVTWSVVAGGGVVGANSSNSDAQGLTSMTATTGTREGVNLVRATIPGPTAPVQVRFVSFGTAGPATSLQIFSGDAGLPGFPATPRVRLSDAFGNPVPGVNVTWVFTTGTGTLSAPFTTSGEDGLASVDYAPLNTSDVAIRAASGALNTTFNLRSNPAATGLVPLSGGDQFGNVTLPLFDPAVAQLTDFGSGIPAAPLTWQILEGGGSLSATNTTTDSFGAAGVVYTAGTKSGTSRIQARHQASGLVANFSFTIEAGPASQIVIASGDNQSAPAGSTPALSLQVLILDAFNNPVGDETVSWAALDGGSVGPLSGTDSYGLASTTIRLGPALGPQRFQATTSLGTVTFIVTAR